MTELIKVLMVDDEEQFRSITSRILSRRGYETTMAGSGEEALQILEASRHDVVVLDIQMPGIDGHEALARIKEIDPDIQVIILTGHGTPDSAKRTLKLRAFDYLAKPCDIDLLAARIDDAYAAAKLSDKEAPSEGEKTAREVMIPIEAYTTIGMDATVREGIEALRESYRGQVSTARIMETGHRSILVFSHGRELAGILSIIDLIRLLQPAYLSAPKPSTADSMEYSPMFWSGLFTTQVRSIADKKMKEVMSDPPATIDDETSLMEIAHLFLTRGIRRIAVTHDGKVVGVVREQELFFEIARICLEN